MHHCDSLSLSQNLYGTRGKKLWMSAVETFKETRCPIANSLRCTPSLRAPQHRRGSPRTPVYSPNLPSGSPDCSCTYGSSYVVDNGRQCAGWYFSVHPHMENINFISRIRDRKAQRSKMRNRMNSFFRCSWLWLIESFRKVSNFIKITCSIHAA